MREDIHPWPRLSETWPLAGLALLTIVMVTLIALPGLADGDHHQHPEALIWTDFDLERFGTDTIHFSNHGAEVTHTPGNQYPQVSTNVPELGTIAVGGKHALCREVWLFTKMKEPPLTARIGYIGERTNRPKLVFPVQHLTYYEPLSSVVMIHGVPNTYAVTLFNPWLVYGYDNGQRFTADLREGYPETGVVEGFDEDAPGFMTTRTFGGSTGEKPQTTLALGDCLYVLFSDGRILAFNPNATDQRVSWHTITHPEMTSHLVGWQVARGLDGWWIGAGQSHLRLWKILDNGSMNPSDWTLEPRPEEWPTRLGPPPRWGVAFGEGVGVSLWNNRSGVHLTNGVLTGEAQWCADPEGRYCGTGWPVRTAILADHTELVSFSRRDEQEGNSWVHEVRRIDWDTMEDTQSPTRCAEGVLWLASAPH